MNKEEFRKTIEKTIKILEKESQSSTIDNCKGGEDFEPIVKNAVHKALNHYGFVVDIDYKPKSHRFPDIILISKNGKYGIEVKSSTGNGKAWRINGNSVMGSTSEPDLIETVIIFGKLSKGNYQFRAKNYEACVANVVVTHSPRYAIDMDIPEGKNFFEISGIPYKTMVESENSIGLITDYFKKEGQKAWWLTESTPAAIRFFRDLSDPEKESLKGYAFVHYPELFSSDNKKYFRFTTWLATEQSIIDPSLRDSFSAGGKTTVKTSKHVYPKRPRIFETLHKNRTAVIAELKNADSECLSADWGVPVSDSFSQRQETWIGLASAQIQKENQTDGNLKKMLAEIIND
ncbi:MAG: hypothetical protein BI182_02090 [Acetobacterium sp. MES1]|uniref:hypothetical protein n=1 Tax=Acetobacterium sp. MES1 TaxID=1899015 RepID=UPI000B9CD6AE|nr:hypothetical protein [Acetobacterium sp. MES1]OXS26522.1 MAG: hypothetical protein BI182_02090 [Acetobacterium sp. MES1]